MYVSKLTDEQWEERCRQHIEGFEDRKASIRATAAATRSEIGVLKAQVAGLLEELAIAQHRIELLEDAHGRRLDRLDGQIGTLERSSAQETALSTGTTAP